MAVVQHPAHIPIHLNHQGVRELLKTNGSVLLVRDPTKATTKGLDKLMKSLCKTFHVPNVKIEQFACHMASDQLGAMDDDTRRLHEYVQKYGINHFLVLTRGGRDPLPLPRDITLPEVEEAIQKEKLGGLMLPEHAAPVVDLIQPERRMDLRKAVLEVKTREAEAAAGAAAATPLGPVMLHSADDVRRFATGPGGAIFMLRDDDHTVAGEMVRAGMNAAVVPIGSRSAVNSTLRPALRAQQGRDHVLLAATAGGKTRIRAHAGPLRADDVIGALSSLRKAMV